MRGLRVGRAAACWATVISSLLTSCTTQWMLRVEEVDVGSLRPDRVPADHWVNPGMLVTFSCDEQLRRLAKKNNVVLVARIEGQDTARVGAVYHTGLVLRGKEDQLRPLGTTTDGDRARFLAVFRLDLDPEWEAAARAGKAMGLQVISGGSFVEYGVSNEVTIGSADPR